MKKLFLLLTVFFISSQIFAVVVQNEFIGTYKGISENGDFIFITDSGQTLLFQDIDYDIDIDLYEDEMIGKKFKVTWKEANREIYNDEGDETGETEKIKKIIDLIAL